MALIRSLAVWVIIYASQCWLGYVNKWNLESADFYMFYAVATLMMVISYVMGRIEDLEENK